MSDCPQAYISCIQRCTSSGSLMCAGRPLGHTSSAPGRSFPGRRRRHCCRKLPCSPLLPSRLWAAACACALPPRCWGRSSAAGPAAALRRGRASGGWAALWCLGKSKQWQQAVVVISAVNHNRTHPAPPATQQRTCDGLEEQQRAQHGKCDAHRPHHCGWVGGDTNGAGCQTIVFAAQTLVHFFHGNHQPSNAWPAACSHMQRQAGSPKGTGTNMLEAMRSGSHCGAPVYLQQQAGSDHFGWLVVC